MGQKKKPESKNNHMTGKLLLAMPGMGDPRFEKAVIYVCAHDENGAMGLVINHSLPGVDLKELLEQMNFEQEPDHLPDQVETLPVLSGGPVETGRGFLLHSPDFRQKETMDISDKISITGTVEALKEIVCGKGPKQLLFILGYAGWQAGQLDQEIQDNAWLITDADEDLVFGLDVDSKWQRAVEKIGINPALLSGQAGHA